jgi:polysaccharide export outer membrane protein
MLERKHFLACALLAAATPGQERPANLPLQKIGPHDLIALSVYDAPELTRTVRVDNEGTITLPLLKRPLTAAGLLPGELERRIAEALREDQILVEPVVKVTIAEYHSRPISVMGAVKKPVTFQAHTPVTLLEALARAEGLGEFAASEIIVTTPGREAPMRIPVQGLINDADAALNIKLTGGEEIRVPEAAKIYIAGNVRKPGAVAVRDKAELSVLKMIALAEGLTPYWSKQAYVYRKDDSPVGKREITVELEKIMKRQTPDVTLEPHDILYIPDNTKRRAGMTVLDRIVLFGSTAGATALVWRR